MQSALSAHTAERLSQRLGVPVDLRSEAYADLWMRNPTRDLPLPDLRHRYIARRGLYLPLSLVTFSVTGSQDLSFSNANTGWTTAINTSGCTWMAVLLSAFIDSTTASEVTFLKYNSVSLLTTYHSNAATAHRALGVLGLGFMALGANAGSNSLEVRWSSSNFLDGQVIFGTGDIDSAVVDGSFQDSEETRSGSISTPSPYTPTTNNALPIFGFATSGLNNTISAATNCTKGQQSALDSGVALFYTPLSTPAGTPTSATINNGNAGFNLTVACALKPSGGSPPAVTLVQLERQLRGVNRGMWGN